jgi:hypothetical protein
MTASAWRMWETDAATAAEVWACAESSSRLDIASRDKPEVQPFAFTPLMTATGYTEAITGSGAVERVCSHMNLGGAIARAVTNAASFSDLSSAYTGVYQVGHNATYFTPAPSDPVVTTRIASGASTTAWTNVLAGAYFSSTPVSTIDPSSEDIEATIQNIRSAAASQTVDPEHLDAAKLAAKQAIELVGRNRLRGRPRVMMSDDGVLTLQWRNETLGAALIFTGDGTVSLALKNAKKTYSDSIQDDVPLDANLPIELVSILESIIG